MSASDRRVSRPQHSAAACRADHPTPRPDRCRSVTFAMHCSMRNTMVFLMLQCMANVTDLHLSGRGVGWSALHAAAECCGRLTRLSLADIGDDRALSRGSWIRSRRLYEDLVARYGCPPT